MITLYKTSHCAYCLTVKKLLDKYKVEYEEILLDDKPELHQSLIEKTKQIQVPIISDGITYISGYYPKQIIELIKKQPKKVRVRVK